MKEALGNTSGHMRTSPRSAESFSCIPYVRAAGGAGAGTGAHQVSKVNTMKLRVGCWCFVADHVRVRAGGRECVWREFEAPATGADWAHMVTTAARGRREESGRRQAEGFERGARGSTPHKSKQKIMRDAQGRGSGPGEGRSLPPKTAQERPTSRLEGPRAAKSVAQEPLRATRSRPGAAQGGPGGPKPLKNRKRSFAIFNAKRRGPRVPRAPQ